MKKEKENSDESNGSSWKCALGALVVFIYYRRKTDSVNVKEALQPWMTWRGSYRVW